MFPHFPPLPYLLLSRVDVLVRRHDEVVPGRVELRPRSVHVEVAVAVLGRGAVVVDEGRREHLRHLGDLGGSHGQGMGEENA